VSFDAFSRDPIARLVQRASDASRLSLLVGAGASMEAGLPSWNALIQTLLDRGARAANLLDVVDETKRDRWLKEAQRDGPLGAAAMVDALAGDDRDAWIVDALYGQAGPERFYPGPIARQIPGLHRVFGDRLRLMTLNYDDLLQQALRDAELQPVTLATADHRFNEDLIPVFHLHGYLGRDGAQGQIVLSEADYQQMQLSGSWQDDLMRTALRDSTVVFVGTSLIDPNMLRYLHAVAAEPGGEHFAIFVRQGAYERDVPTGLPEARERALTRRWESVGVVAVFVDHFTDVAQVLAEISRRRSDPAGYQPLDERARGWLSTVERDILGLGDETAFQRAQEVISGLLNETLRSAIAAAESLTSEQWEETLALSLWLCDVTGTKMTSWVTTDRLHRQQATIEPLPIDEHSSWVAIRSYCRGTPMAESHQPDGSRWRFVRGTPLTLHTDHHGRMPIGCLTTASLAPREQTHLDRMPGEVEAAFNDTMSDAVLAFLNQPFSA